MTSTRTATAVVAVLLLAAWAGACSLLPPRTAEDVIARSVRAHGGDRLTTWQTFSIRGTVEMQDGIMYRAAYLVYAKMPGRLRVEQDMTADRGRIFNEYFLNDGVAWSRRNLILNKADIKQLQRWMNQCYAIAHYASRAKSMTRKPDASVEWKTRPGGPNTPYQVAATRPAYVVTVGMEEGATDLFIDKETFYLLQETTPDRRRVFSDFKSFEGAVWPTAILEVTKGRQGEVLTPYTFQDVKYNAPIEDWLFTEDRPAPVK
ncbi:MAG: hypothetical protein IMZ67_04865 [Acidobacteria bacterium]|nr:hypothetical protein [Acidobacteriota bacterium]